MKYRNKKNGRIYIVIDIVINKTGDHRQNMVLYRDPRGRNQMKCVMDEFEFYQEFDLVEGTK